MRKPFEYISNNLNKVQAKIKSIPTHYTNKKRRIAIVTNCCDDWGGSEELWARSIPYLQEKGFGILVIKDKINRKHPKYVSLSKKGVLLNDLDTFSKKTLPVRLLTRIWKKIRKGEFSNHLHSNFQRRLKKYQPHLVVISQCINFDGLFYAYICALRRIPYVIVSQKAVEFYWPPTSKRSFMTKAFQQAKKCFFVSQHNEQLTEEQFGIRFNNAELIFNPVNIPASPMT